MGRIEDDFAHDMYLFLPKSVRDADVGQGNLLERYLTGPQLVWEGTQDSALAVKTLFSVDDIADDYLPYLKWTVGWTSETTLDAITADLTPDELRKLIRVSVAMWKLKGSELGYRGALRVITGRDVLVRNWFTRRWVLDVTGIWQLGMDTDPYLVDDEHGDRDEYLTQIWIHNEVGIEREMIRRIINLNRPLQEVVNIGYADLVDDFRLGRQKWVTDAGTDVTWDDENFRLVVPSGTTIRANVPALDAAGDVLWRHRVAFTGASGGSVQMDFRRQEAAPNDRYRATWNQDGTLQLEVVQGGLPTVIATGDVGHSFPQDETTIIGVTISEEDSGDLQIRVVAYDDDVVDEIVSGADVLDPGQWRFTNSSVNDVRIDDVIAYELPLTVDQVSGLGDVVG